MGHFKTASFGKLRRLGGSTSLKLENIVRHAPWAALLAISLIAVSLVGVRHLRFDDDPTAIFRSQSTDFLLLRELETQFTTDENDVLVILEGDDLMSPENLSLLRTLVDRTIKLPGIDSVTSILNMRRVGSRTVPLVPYPGASPDRFQRARDEAKVHPLVRGQLLSEDGRTMAMIVRLAGDALSTADIDQMLEQLRDVVRTSTAESSISTYLAGHPAVRVENLATLQREQFKFALLSGVVSTVVGMFMLRRFAAVLIVAATAATGVLWTLGFMGFIGERINGLNTVVPTLVFVLGFSDAIHVMLDVQFLRGKGASRAASAALGLREVGMACLICEVTTAIGFASLLAASTESVQRLGLISAVGAMFSFLATVTVLPVLVLTPLGDRLAVPPRYSRLRISRLPLVACAFRRPWMTWLIGAALGVVALLYARTLKPDLRWMEAVPAASETSRAMRRCDEAFGGALLGYVLLEWPADRNLAHFEVRSQLSNVHAIVAAEPLARGPLSVQSLWSALPGGEDVAARTQAHRKLPARLLRRMLREDERRLLVAFHLPDAGMAALAPTFDRIRQKLAALERENPGYRFELTGASVVAAGTLTHVIGDLGRSLASAGIAIFLVLVWGFQSVRLALISILPNALPLWLVAGYLALTARPLQLASAMTFNVCVGMAVNDTVHFLLRFKQLRRRGFDVLTATERSLQKVGAAMITSTVILVGGFACMLSSSMPAIRLFAELTCLTMAAALYGDLLVLPAMLLCFVRDVAKRPRVDHQANAIVPAAIQ